MKFIRNTRTGRLHAYDKTLLDLPHYVVHDEDGDVEQIDSKDVCFRLSVTGIGDAVCGLYAACGIADAGFTVNFYCNQPAWLARAKHPGVNIVRSPESGVIDANYEYKEQLKAAHARACPSRSDWYLRNIARRYRLPEGVAPARPAQILPAESRPVEGEYVLLAPGVDIPTRMWPEVHWMRLAIRLRESGFKVVACSVRREADLLQNLKADAVFIDAAPNVVLDLVQNAHAVYGNESGIAHVAGLLGVPCVLPMAQTTRSFVHAFAPTVVDVTSDLPCIGCHWQRAGGWTEQCSRGCSALQAISPEQVLKAGVKLAPRAKKRAQPQG